VLVPETFSEVPHVTALLSLVTPETVKFWPKLVSSETPNPPAMVAAPVVEEDDWVVPVTAIVGVDTPCAANSVALVNVPVPPTFRLPAMLTFCETPTPPVTITAPVVDELDPVLDVKTPCPATSINPATLRFCEIPTPPVTTTVPVVVELDPVPAVNVTAPPADKAPVTVAAFSVAVELVERVPVTTVLPELTAAKLDVPLVVRVPPIFTFCDTPNPPVTTVAPVVVEVDEVPEVAVTIPLALRDATLEEPETVSEFSEANPLVESVPVMAVFLALRAASVDAPTTFSVVPTYAVRFTVNVPTFTLPESLKVVEIVEKLATSVVVYTASHGLLSVPSVCVFPDDGINDGNELGLNATNGVPATVKELAVNAPNVEAPVTPSVPVTEADASVARADVLSVVTPSPARVEAPVTPSVPPIVNAFVMPAEFNVAAPPVLNVVVTLAEFNVANPVVLTVPALTTPSVDVPVTPSVPPTVSAFVTPAEFNVAAPPVLKVVPTANAFVTLAELSVATLELLRVPLTARFPELTAPSVEVPDTPNVVVTVAEFNAANPVVLTVPALTVPSVDVPVTPSAPVTEADASVANADVLNVFKRDDPATVNAPASTTPEITLLLNEPTFP
jgi:hypothetical protein